MEEHTGWLRHMLSMVQNVELHIRRLQLFTARHLQIRNSGKVLTISTMVVALNEKGEVVAISKLIHVATKGGKVGNCKKLKVNKSKVNLKQGKKFKLKVKQIAESKKVKLKKHRR